MNNGKEARGKITHFVRSSLKTGSLIILQSKRMAALCCKQSSEDIDFPLKPGF
jgi:hypothetical protein